MSARTKKEFERDCIQAKKCLQKYRREVSIGATHSKTNNEIDKQIITTALHRMNHDMQNLASKEDVIELGRQMNALKQEISSMKDKL